MEASESREEQTIQPDSDFARDWPDDIRLLCARLFEQYSGDEIRGLDRLGARSFDDAPDKVEAIKGIIKDLSLEEWEPSLASSELSGQLQELMNALDEMVALSSNQDDFVQRSGNLNDRLQGLYTWFRQIAAPLAFSARVKKVTGEVSGLEEGKEQVERLRSDTSNLNAEVEKLKHDLESSQEAVTQARAAAGESASEEQEAVFKDRAKDYEEVATKWLWALIISVPIAAGLALVTFLALRPDSGSKDVHDFAGLGFGLFVLGLLAFGIRICAQNFRVNRHLATVARSKQASISTFQRMVASVSDDELRSAVTLTLVQAIFAVEETGLVDGSGDHVTLVERALIPNLPKAS